MTCMAIWIYRNSNDVFFAHFFAQASRSPSRGLVAKQPEAATGMHRPWGKAANCMLDRMLDRDSQNAPPAARPALRSCCLALPKGGGGGREEALEALQGELTHELLGLVAPTASDLCAHSRWGPSLRRAQDNVLLELCVACC